MTNDDNSSRIADRQDTNGVHSHRQTYRCGRASEEGQRSAYFAGESVLIAALIERLCGKPDAQINYNNEICPCIGRNNRNALVSHPGRWEQPRCHTDICNGISRIYQHTKAANAICDGGGVSI